MITSESNISSISRRNHSIFSCDAYNINSDFFNSIIQIGNYARESYLKIENLLNGDCRRKNKIINLTHYESIISDMFKQHNIDVLDNAWIVDSMRIFIINDTNESSDLYDGFAISYNNDIYSIFINKDILDNADQIVRFIYIFTEYMIINKQFRNSNINCLNINRFVYDIPYIVMNNDLSLMDIEFIMYYYGTIFKNIQNLTNNKVVDIKFLCRIHLIQKSDILRIEEYESIWKFAKELNAYDYSPVDDKNFMDSFKLIANHLY